MRNTSPRKTKKVVVIPDKFKGSLTAIEVARSISRGIQKHDPELKTISIPMADGGEGSLQILRRKERRLCAVSVHDPLFRKIRSPYLYDPLTRTAFIEISLCSGLHLLKSSERNCLKTTTYGVGELISHALEQKPRPRRIYLFLGGSATNDAGIGMAGALGFAFHDRMGNPLPLLSLTGENLIRIRKILPPSDLSLLRQTQFMAVADVTSPLFGKRGAAYVFAPQKGADPDSVRILDRGLRNIGKYFSKIPPLPGSGAAGGLGAGARFFLQADLIGGADFFIQEAGVREAIRDADVVISGEGCLDPQTREGKVVFGIGTLIKKTHKKHRPVYVVICGKNSAPSRVLKEIGIDKVVSLTEWAGEEKAMRETGKILEEVAEYLCEKEFFEK